MEPQQIGRAASVFWFRAPAAVSRIVFQANREHKKGMRKASPFLVPKPCLAWFLWHPQVSLPALHPRSLTFVFSSASAVGLEASAVCSAQSLALALAVLQAQQPQQVRLGSQRRLGGRHLGFNDASESGGLGLGFWLGLRRGLLGFSLPRPGAWPQADDGGFPADRIGTATFSHLGAGSAGVSLTASFGASGNCFHNGFRLWLINGASWCFHKSGFARGGFVTDEDRRDRFRAFAVFPHVSTAVGAVSSTWVSATASALDFQALAGSVTFFQRARAHSGILLIAGLA